MNTILTKLSIDKKHPYPLYLQLADQLRQIIRDGAIKENAPLPPERELSKNLEINHLTVRKALGILEAEGSIYNIRGKGRFVQRLTDSPGHLATETLGRIIGIVAPEVYEDSNIGLTIRGAVEYLHRKAFRVLRISVRDQKDELNRLETYRKQITGIIFCGQHSSKGILKSLNFAKSENLPVVLIEQGNLDNVDQITYNEQQGVYDALTFLYENGHRDIAFFCGISNPQQISYRKIAYEHFINDFSLSPLIFEYPISSDKNHTDAAHEQTLKLLRKKSLPKAIMASNDANAIGIYSALQEAGLTPGKDVELIGFGNIFDDSPCLRTYGYPISSVEIPKRKLGSKAAELLLKKMSNPCLNIKVPPLATKLVHRGTTAI